MHATQKTHHCICTKSSFLRTPPTKYMQRFFWPCPFNWHTCKLAWCELLGTSITKGSKLFRRLCIKPGARHVHDFYHKPVIEGYQCSGLSKHLIVWIVLEYNMGQLDGNEMPEPWQLDFFDLHRFVLLFCDVKNQKSACGSMLVTNVAPWCMHMRIWDSSKIPNLGDALACRLSHNIKRRLMCEREAFENQANQCIWPDGFACMVCRMVRA